MAKKKTARKKADRKTATRATKKKTPAKKATKRKSVKKPATKRRTTARRKRKISLGRPKVTADEKLYMLFKEDFHARQIFAFLRVETVRELEEYSPQQIVRKLSQPIKETVERIRQKLADKNRSLLEDQEYAAAHKSANKR